MTTVDFTLQDPAGGELTLCAHDLRQNGYVVAKTTGTLTSLNLASDGAEALIEWLQQTFELMEESEADGPANHLRIVVPGAAGGEPREVTWSGNEEPPEWFERLAVTALTGVTRRSIQEATEVFKGLRGEPRTFAALTVLDRIQGMLRDAGLDQDRSTVDVIQELVAFNSNVREVLHARRMPSAQVVGRIRDVYREASEQGNVTPEERRAVRDCMAHLGVEQVRDLADRVAGLLGQVDVAVRRTVAAQEEADRLKNGTLALKLATARAALERIADQLSDGSWNVQDLTREAQDGLAGSDPGVDLPDPKAG